MMRGSCNRDRLLLMCLDRRQQILATVVVANFGYEKVSPTLYCGRSLRLACDGASVFAASCWLLAAGAASAAPPLPTLLAFLVY